MIVSGSASQSLSAALAAELDEPLAPVETTRFPDGEFKLRVGYPEEGASDDEPADDDGVIIDSTAEEPTDAGTVERAVVVASTVSSDAHVEVLQLQDAASEWADEVVTVLPYMGYGRQDEAFEPGEPVSARAVARAISTGCDRVLTVNPHEEYVCEFFDVPAEAVDAADRLAEPLPADLREPLFLSPDAGATDEAETTRDAYGRGDTDHFEKTRHSATEVEVAPSEVDVEGRDVVLVDDSVATGSTMSEAIEHLHERDVGGVYVTCVHALLVDTARTRLARAGVEAIYGTDTVERPVSAVSAAPSIAARL